MMILLLILKREIPQLLIALRLRLPTVRHPDGTFSALCVEAENECEKLGFRIFLIFVKAELFTISSAIIKNVYNLLCFPLYRSLWLWSDSSTRLCILKI